MTRTLEMKLLLLCAMLSQAVKGQIQVSGLTCVTWPVGQSGCDGALTDDDTRAWTYYGTAYNSWYRVNFEDYFNIKSVRFKQLEQSQDKNFRSLRLDFTDGSSQSVTFTNFSSGLFYEEFVLDPVVTSWVNMTVTSAVGSQFGTTYNGLVEVQYFGFPTMGAGLMASGPNEITTMTPAAAAGPSTSVAPTLLTTAETPATPSTTTPTTPTTPTTQPTTPATIATTTPAPSPTPAPSTPAPPTAAPTAAPPTGTPPTTPPPTAASTTPQTTTPSTPPPTTNPVFTEPDPGPQSISQTVLFAIVGVIVVLVISLIITVSIFCYRRRSAKKDTESDIVIEEMGPEHGMVNTGFDQNLRASGIVCSNPIPVEQLLDHIINLSHTPGGFKDEFTAIRTGPRYAVSASQTDDNIDKNRFINILAYDHTRVKLVVDDEKDTDYVNVQDIGGNDYINANYVTGYKKECEFIASQGPLNTTISDFWRMIWQQNVSKIVMVTNVVERNRPKCAYYWPSEGSDQHGSFRIRLEKEESFSEYVIRILEITKGKEKKTVLQYHFVAWPDEGAPTTGTSLLALQDLINLEPSNGNDGPIVIHCSAGIGRTGTFIAVNYLKKQAAEEGLVDVMGCVNSMREDRINMVQSLEQYTYIYTTVLEALYCGCVRWSATEFLTEYSPLVDSSFEGEETPADKHFKVLEALKPTAYHARIKSAQDPANRAKNRVSYLLPAENVQTFLQPISGSPSNYVNAILVDDLKKRDSLIVTQMPLPNTQVDFWRLVSDFKCRCIVMLNDLLPGSQDSPPYWPPLDESLVLGSFTIKTNNVSSGNDVIITDLSFKAAHKSKEEKNIHHIRVTNWPDEYSLPNSPKVIIDLYKELKEIESKSGEGLVMIHCLYGAEKSGLVCAALSILEAIQSHGFVDVFNVVKRIRRSRPHFISSPAQYKFLHTIAKEFVEAESVLPS